MDIELRNSFLRDLLGLVSIESVTGNTRGIRTCFEYIEGIADRFGFCTNWCAGGKVLEVFPKNCSYVPRIGIVTHVDTVPIDKQNWIHNPFGEIANGRVYGRGTIDDKVGIIHSLYAFKELEGEIEPSWKMIIGSSEEGKWIDMRDYIAEENIIPSFVFTIDGDGIQHGCRGSLNVKLIFKRYCKDSMLKRFNTIGGAQNIVPNLVRVETDFSTCEIHGESVHSSIPEKGVNAICEAYIFYSDFIKKEFPGFYMFMNNCLNSSKGEAMFIEEGGRIITSEEVPTSIVTPTMCKLKRDTLTVTVNIRLSPTIIAKRIVSDAIEKAKQVYDCEIIVDNLIMPAYTYPSSNEIILMQDAYEKVMGRRPVSKVALGTGYNATFPDAAIFGPRFDDIDETEEDLCHRPEESRSIRDIETFYDILKEYIRSSIHK